MRIVFAASECVPFAKTGGLADVVGALGPEMVKLGHEVTVYLPFYARVRPRIEGELKYVAQSITIPFEYYNRFVAVDRALEAFRDKPGWTKLMRNGMRRDYSWKHPTLEYAAVYEEGSRRRS